MGFAALEKMIKTTPADRQAAVQNLILLEILREIRRKRN